MAHWYVIEHGLMNEEKTMFNWRGLDLRVVAEKEKITYTEREDAGGGAYWYGGTGIKKTATVERLFAYDGEYLVGEIIESAQFRNPNMKHIKISRVKDKVL